MRILFLWRCEWTIFTYDLSHRTSEAVFRLREDSLPFAFEQQFKPNHKVLKPFSVVNVSGPQIFQAVRRAEELSLRLAFR